VFTNSSIGANVINSGDGYCSLAEAIKSVNDGVSVANCTDIDPSNPGRISLTPAPNKPFSTNHYVIGGTTFTLTRSVLITTSEEGFVAFIDSSGSLAFKVNNGVNVSFYGLDIRHTGTGSGRLVWNAGTLSMGSSFIRNGNVTTEPTGRGGGIYNERTGNLSLYSSQVLNNSAKRGGGIYNDDGVIQNLDATISGNSATMAGGGLYNFRSGVNANAVVNMSAIITNNSAKAGGGIVNFGGQIFVNSNASITSNSTVAGSVTGGGELCHSGTCTPANPGTCHSGPCDGNGAGVLNIDASTSLIASIVTMAPLTVSSNTAVNYGGAFYNTGQLNLDNVTISGNRAKSGAAIFAAGLIGSSSTQPASNYCQVLNSNGPSSITSNTATGTPSNAVYSIVDSSGADQTFCVFHASASGNTNPYCKAAGVRPGTTCPQ